MSPIPPDGNSPMTLLDSGLLRGSDIGCWWLVPFGDPGESGDAVGDRCCRREGDQPSRAVWHHAIGGLRDGAYVDERASVGCRLSAGGDLRGLDRRRQSFVVDSEALELHLDVSRHQKPP
ncbi:MAG: hypothetical protein H0X61_06745 [Acidimicrobiia bacterium]|jgi:hypothetical protein|nr:hypothetical protein [Acidimicrobiia bacterium]